MKGIGIDILETGRVESMVDNQMRGFIRQLTEKETEGVLEQEDQYIVFAKRFSLKEAVYESLHTFEDMRSSQGVEILTDSNSTSFVSLYGGVKEITDKNGISQILSSVSYEGNTIVLMAFTEQKIRLKYNTEKHEYDNLDKPLQRTVSCYVDSWLIARLTHKKLDNTVTSVI